MNTKRHLQLIGYGTGATNIKILAVDLERAAKHIAIGGGCGSEGERDILRFTFNG
jgi:hypothetical protein